MYNYLTFRDVAQLGSALPWGGRGRQFKPDRSDQLTKNARFFLAFYIFNITLSNLCDK